MKAVQKQEGKQALKKPGTEVAKRFVG